MNTYSSSTLQRSSRTSWPSLPSPPVFPGWYLFNLLQVPLVTGTTLCQGLLLLAVRHVFPPDLTQVTLTEEQLTSLSLSLKTSWSDSNPYISDSFQSALILHSCRLDKPVLLTFPREPPPSGCHHSPLASPPLEQEGCFS